ncbi:MAG TPA: thioredoxin domain-containing protein [Candidatus Eisenbacteria bacterium]|nr:thioredoxin domain-containing protein [Candidatus Eisenbacteria bacterium]
MAPRPTRHRVALVIALVGLAVSGVILDVDRRLATQAGYTSFCNMGGVVNCDAVLSSRYGTFLDMPVALWAGVAFAAGVVAAIPGAVLGIYGGLADLVLIALASGGLGFSAVLATIMAVVLHYACLLCLTLDLVVVAWFVTVLPLARNFHAAPGAGWLRRRVAAHATAALALAVALAGGTFAAVRSPAPADTVADVEARDPEFARQYVKLPVVPLRDVVRPDAPSKGPANAPVTIVEFSDFECPACGQAFKDLHDLLRARTDVRLVFRHFPLDSSCNEAMSRTVHVDACLAAAAAECAQAQNRFWEYHDLLFENQKTLDRESLFRYAREAGLDIPTFRTCLDDPMTRDRVGTDVRAGIAAGIESTPTLFINGRRVSGALERTYYDYALILEKAQGATASGRP